MKSSLLKLQHFFSAYPYLTAIIGILIIIIIIPILVKKKKTMITLFLKIFKPFKPVFSFVKNIFISKDKSLVGEGFDSVSKIKKTKSGQLVAFNIHITSTIGQKISEVEAILPNMDYSITQIQEEVYLLESSTICLLIFSYSSFIEAEMTKLKKIINNLYTSRTISLPSVSIYLDDSLSIKNITALKYKIQFLIHDSSYKSKIYLAISNEYYNMAYSDISNLYIPNELYRIGLNNLKQDISKTIEQRFEILYSYILAAPTFTEDNKDKLLRISKCFSGLYDKSIILLDKIEFFLNTNVSSLVSNFEIELNYNFSQLNEFHPIIEDRNFYSKNYINSNKKLKYFFTLISIGLSLGFIVNIYILHKSNITLSTIKISDKDTPKVALEKYYYFTSSVLNKLFMPFLYKSNSVNIANVQMHLYMENYLLNKFSEKNNLNENFIILLTVTANSNKEVKQFIINNIDKWSFLLDTSSEALRIYLETISKDNNSINMPNSINSIPVIPEDILNINEYNFDIIDNNMLDKYILSDYKNQLKYYYIAKLVKSINASNLNGVSFNDNKLLQKYDSIELIEKQISHSAVLLEISDTGELQGIDTVYELPQALIDYSSKISIGLSKLDIMSSEEIKAWKKILISAYLESAIEKVLKKRLNNNIKNFKITDPDSHVDGIIFDNIDIDLKYSIPTIKDYIIPFILNSKIAEKNLKELGLNKSYSSIHDLSSEFLKSYINEYIKYFNNIISKLYDMQIKKINSDDTDLMKLNYIFISKSAPNNILSYVVKNTNVNEEYISKYPGFISINDNFSNLEKYFNDKNGYKDYQEKFKKIYTIIKDSSPDSYKKAYQYFFSGGEKSVNKILKENIESYDFNENISSLFIEPIDIIEETLSRKQIGNSILKWNMKVSNVVAKLNDLFPFNLSSKTEVDPDKLKEMIYENGTLYQLMLNILNPYIYMDSYHDEYKLHEIKYISEMDNASIHKMLDIFNSFYKVSNAMWDNTGVPKNLKILAQPLPYHSNNKLSYDYDYIYSSGTTIVGMNTSQIGWHNLDAKWYGIDSASVTIVKDSKVTSLSNESINYNLFKLFNKASCEYTKKSDEITCTWNIEESHDKVSFKFKSDIFKLIN